MREGGSTRDRAAPHRPRLPARRRSRRGRAPLVDPVRARPSARAANGRPRLPAPAATSRTRSSCGRRAASPGHDHTASSCARGCTLDDARRASRRRTASPTSAATDDHCYLVDPDGYGIELDAVHAARARPPTSAPRTTATLPGFRPRKLGHVNVPHRPTWTRCATSTATCSAWASPTTSGRRRLVLTSTPTTTSMALVGKTLAHFHHFALRLRRLGHAARRCSTTSASTAAGSAGARCATRSAQNLCGYVRIPEEQLLRRAATATWSSSSPTTQPRDWPDDPHSSNIWGILPPRSYFRFDELRRSATSARAWTRHGRSPAAPARLTRRPDGNHRAAAADRRPAPASSSSTACAATRARSG